MTFLHFLYRRRLGLLAASALEPSEADSVLKHTRECPSCQAELTALTRVSLSLRLDAAQDRPLPIFPEALRTRVLARIRADAPRNRQARAWSQSWSVAAAAFVGIGALAIVVATRLPPPPRLSDSGPVSEVEVSGETGANDAAFYERLEKTQVRANAVRYLSEAQGVLIQVAAAAIDCPDSPKDSVDVAEESRTSRQLLNRRAALVSGSYGTLVAARGVMEEVEGLLQEVADLPQCTRRKDVDAIARRVDRRQLLMKIDLVTQELAAP